MNHSAKFAGTMKCRELIALNCRLLMCRKFKLTACLESYEAKHKNVCLLNLNAPSQTKRVVLSFSETL